MNKKHSETQTQCRGYRSKIAALGVEAESIASREDKSLGGSVTRVGLGSGEGLTGDFDAIKLLTISAL